LAANGKREMSTPGDLLRSGSTFDDELSAVELLAQAPIDRIDDAVRTLKERSSADEIRKALIERIARAPLSDFQALKTVYLTHCVDPAR